MIRTLGIMFRMIILFAFGCMVLPGYAERKASASAEGMGTLYLRGVPAAAEIWINENPLHRAASEPIVLSPGTVSLKISSGGTQILKSFALRAGDVKVINFNGHPDYASVDLISEPLDAEVFLDNAKQGNTPFLDSLVEPGFHVITVKKSGYDPVAREVNLVPQEDLELTVDLKRSKAWIDSMARAKVLKRKKRQFVERMVFTALGAACAGAAGYFDNSAQRNSKDAEAMAQTYDAAHSGFDNIRAGYYDNRNAASQNIRRRDIAAGLAGGTVLGILLTFVF